MGLQLVIASIIG